VVECLLCKQKPRVQTPVPEKKIQNINERVEDVAQVVELLPSLCKALDSNSSNEKKKTGEQLNLGSQRGASI
jgi:hypothetical protein